MPRPERPQRNYSLLFLVLIIAAFTFVVMQLNTGVEERPTYTYAEMMRDIAAGSVTGIVVTPSADVPGVGTADVRLPGGIHHTVQLPNLDVFMQAMHVARAYERLASFDAAPPPRQGWFMSVLPFLIIGFVMVIVVFFVMNQTGAGAGGGRSSSSFGKTRARMTPQDSRTVKFSQVAGLDEEKEELAEIVDFLRAPEKYRTIGARIPKGVLLVGPPGTGKTYLARAVAGEANVPFFSISGSDFVEMFVGVGASRVRDLFDQAKRHPASIIIIDEIDAVGRRRGAGLGGGHDEREQTLNQMLVEMDGFGANEGVIVLAATNRPDILDPALLRPGRFDRRIAVNPPDVKGREAVLAVHADGKKLAREVSMKTVAQTTAGFTPADLENLLNESALLAARAGKPEIDMEAIKQALIKVGIGTEKKSRVITEKERRITAYHEAGHAICFEVLSEMDSTYMVSVIPTGRAGGWCMPLPGEDRNFLSRKFMQQSIVSLLGGRAAEHLVLNDITNGATNDIERATQAARNMVVKFGMSDDLGPIQFGSEAEEVFLGRDLAHTRNYGEQVANLIDAEIKRIVEGAYREAVGIIETHMEILHRIVGLLLEKERVSGDEIRSLFPYGTLVQKERANALLGTA